MVNISRMEYEELLDALQFCEEKQDDETCIRESQCTMLVQDIICERKRR